MTIIFSKISILISNTNYYQKIQFVWILIGNTNQNRGYQSIGIHIRHTTPIFEYQSFSRIPTPIGNINSPESLTGIPILIRNTNPYIYHPYQNTIFPQITFTGTHTGHQNGDQKEKCTFPYLEYQFVYQFISITFTGTLFSIKSPLEEHREVIKRGSER